MRRVASGIGLFHVEWLAADRFAFEDDPRPSGAFASVRKKVLAKPAVKEFVAEAKRRGEMGELEQMLDMLVLEHVSKEVEAGRMKPLSPEESQEERLLEYRTSSRKTVSFNELRHVRLFGEFQYPNLRGSFVEVPAD